MAPKSFLTCDICGEFPAAAGGLVCGHHFCPDCFHRYVNGSVLELHTSLRCSVCGKTSPIISEIDAGGVLVTFGRNDATKLLLPVGFARSSNGNYIIVDKKKKRVSILCPNGRLCNDFAYVYNTEPFRGMAITTNGDLAIPFRDMKYDYVAYFNNHGTLIGSAYLRKLTVRPIIQGVACDLSRNLLYMTDSVNSCVHVIDNSTKSQCNRYDLEPIQSETKPEPCGIAVANNGMIYLTDVANHCIKQYSAQGSFISKIGCFGERPVQFDTPTAVTTTDDNDIIVADRGNQRVQHLTSSGAFLRYIVCFKAGSDVFMAPSDVIACPDGRIAVLMTPTQFADVGAVRIY